MRKYSLALKTYDCIIGEGTSRGSSMRSRELAVNAWITPSSHVIKGSPYQMFNGSQHGLVSQLV